MRVIFLLLALISCTHRQVSNVRNIELKTHNHISQEAMKDYAYLLAFSNCHPQKAVVSVKDEEQVQGKYTLSYSCEFEKIEVADDQLRALKICADPQGEKNSELCQELVLDSLSFALSSLDSRFNFGLAPSPIDP